MTHNAALGPDGGGGVYVYGHGAPSGSIDGHGDNLYRFHRPNGGVWDPWSLYVSGAYDRSVGVRWAQFFHASPATIGVIYWANPYPNALYFGTEPGSGTIPPTPTPTATPTSTPTPTITAGATTLVGDQQLQPQQDYNPAGVAEAFQYTAGASGTVASLTIYLDASRNASSVVVGLYTESGSNSPGTLLAQGTLGTPITGAWNTVLVPQVNVGSSINYWIAVLGPSGNGIVRFRDSPSGGLAQTSAQTTSNVLPTTWPIGTIYSNSPMSAFASGS